MALYMSTHSLERPVQNLYKPLGLMGSIILCKQGALNVPLAPENRVDHCAATPYITSWNLFKIE